jgi:hypothetical protein
VKPTPSAKILTFKQHSRTKVASAKSDARENWLDGPQSTQVWSYRYVAEALGVVLVLAAIAAAVYYFTPYGH